MNIVILLAAGKGTRLKNSSIPKQFIKIKNKPLYLYSLEQFIMSKLVDKAIVVVNKEWIEETKKNIRKKIKTSKDIFVVEGGSYRNDSIYKGLTYISNNIKEIDIDDNIITHDSARPFINSTIIETNILNCQNDNIVSTAISSIDTVVYQQQNQLSVLDRNNVFKIQTPQTIKYANLKELFNNEILDTSDLISLARSKQAKLNIKLVEGTANNFKVTTNEDLMKLILLLKNNKNIGV